MAYSAPSTISTGDLITAAKWNSDVSANPIAIYAGAMSVASQAVGDILYASSTTQFARVAAVAAGQVLASAGTGTVPAYSATPALTSVDMGGTTVYGSRAITVDTGGVLNVVLASSAGDDFTVDTDKLVVSGDSGAVGVGTAAPVSLLDVRGPTGTGATPAGLLTLATAELTVVDNDQLGRINFQAPLESSGSDAILAVASIYAEATATFSATVNSTDLIFATATDGAVVEHLRLDSRGTMRFGVDAVERGVLQNEAWGTVWGNNGYYNGSAWVAIATAASSHIVQDSSGGIIFRSAPSVSAGASTSAIDNITITAAGSVGIGSTVPRSPLHVALAAGTHGNIQVGGNTTVLGTLVNYQSVASGYSNISQLNNSGGANARMNFGFGVIASDVPTNTVMTLNQDGHVGIGTATPDHHLDVSGGLVQIRSVNDNALKITQNDADIYPSAISLTKSRGSYASPGDVVNGDGVGTIKSTVWSGSMYFAGAKIDYAVDGTFTSNQRPPSRMTFSTNAANASVTERMRITSAGFVGIGTAAPDRQLEVVTSAAELCVFNSTATNGGTVEIERSGARKVALGTQLGITGQGNNNNGVVAGGHTGDSGHMTIYGYYNAVNSGIQFTDGWLAPVVDNVISVGASSYRWSVVYATNGTINTSDEREKRDIVDSSLGLDFVNSLRPVSYRWRSGPNGDKRFFGLTAQDVDEVAPPGTAFVSKENPDSWGLSYGEFTAPMIKAIQELSSRVQELEAALASK